MTAPKLAKGAQPILDARMQGRRPADLVLVALAEPLQTNNPVVYADAATRYDWRWVRGLDLCLYVADGDDWPGILEDIARARPAHLELWNHEGQWGAHVYLIPTAQDVEKPVSMWRQELDFLPWLDCQNQDFIASRRYARDEHGMPYVINP